MTTLNPVEFVHIKTTNPEVPFPFKSIEMYSNEDMEIILTTPNASNDSDVWIMHPGGQARDS